MSVVAVKIEEGEITIGADSYVGFGDASQLKNHVKLVECNGLVMGSVGYAKDLSLIRLYAMTHKPKSSSEEGITEFISEFVEWNKKKFDDYHLDSWFIIVFEGRAFLATHDFYVKRVIDYESIGAGMNFAMTALKLGKNVEEAIDIACEMCIYCEKPIRILKIREAKE